MATIEPLEQFKDHGIICARENISRAFAACPYFFNAGSFQQHMNVLSFFFGQAISMPDMAASRLSQVPAACRAWFSSCLKTLMSRSAAALVKEEWAAVGKLFLQACSCIQQTCINTINTYTITWVFYVCKPVHYLHISRWLNSMHFSGGLKSWRRQQRERGIQSDGWMEAPLDQSTGWMEAPTVPITGFMVPMILLGHSLISETFK